MQVHNRGRKWCRERRVANLVVYGYHEGGVRGNLLVLAILRHRYSTRTTKELRQGPSTLEREDKWPLVLQGLGRVYSPRYHGEAQRRD